MSDPSQGTPKEQAKRWIEEIVAITGLTPTEIARRADVASTTLTRPLTPDHPYGLSLTTIVKIQGALAGYALPPSPMAETRRRSYWTAHKAAPMEQYDERAQIEGASLPSRHPSGSAIEIPEYDVRFAAGGGLIVDEASIKSLWRFPRSYIVNELKLNPHTLVIAEVVGDSMEPTLGSGDRVLIDQADKRIANPGVFALWDGDGLVVKRLERVFGSDPLMVRVISDNPRHSTYEVPGETVNVIGRIRWRTQRM